MISTNIPRWKVKHPDLGANELVLTGFSKKLKARHHAWKHFLNLSEAWDQCKPVEHPTRLIKKLTGGNLFLFNERMPELSEPDKKVLEDAVSAYQDAIMKVNSSSHIFVGARQKDNKRLLTYIVSDFGVFSVFGRNLYPVGQKDVSEILTSYRPSTREGAGNVKKSHYLRSAVRKLVRKLNKSAR
ncbi:MAG: hypothetical protein GXP49_06325 [Deltaproteobacteria bacterium]|nr:hypothetical protein [Deltaproteobacteria bacterium]